MGYEFDGKKYREASIHQKEWGAQVISDLPLKGSEKLLDLGCGDGVLTAKIAALLPQGYVLGIDSSKGMIQTANELQGSNLQFEQMDIAKLPFDNEFDVVFYNAALHWVKDHRRLMRKVHKALRPEGRIRFNFAGDGNCANFFRVIKKAIGLPEYKNSFNAFIWPWYMPKITDYEVLVKDFGFTEIKVWGENADRNFATADQMINWIDQPSLVPFLKHVDYDKRQGFRDLVVQKMLKNTIQDDGTYLETFRRVNVFAIK